PVPSDPTGGTKHASAVSRSKHLTISARFSRRSIAFGEKPKELAVSLLTARVELMGSGDEVEILRQVISNVHGCESRHLESIHVLETFQGQTVWDGQVQVFE